MDDRHSAPASISADFAPLRLRMRASGHVFDLTSPNVLLGRHSDADLRLPLPDVSRQHCRFLHTVAGWQVIDLGSLNGVYVNGLRVRSPVVLCPGDHIRICGVELEVEAVDAVPPPDPREELLRGLTGSMPTQPLHRWAS